MFTKNNFKVHFFSLLIKKKVHLLLFVQSHGWNRRAGVFSSSFELLLPRGEVYHCIVFIPSVCVCVHLLYSDEAVSEFLNLHNYEHIISSDIVLISQCHFAISLIFG